MFGKTKKGANHCSPVCCSLKISKQSCKLSRHRNWDKQSSRCALVMCEVRWIANQNIRKRRRILWYRQPISKKDCNSFTVCLRSMGNNFPPFFSFRNKSISWIILQCESLCIRLCDFVSDVQWHSFVSLCACKHLGLTRDGAKTQVLVMMMMMMMFTCIAQSLHAIIACSGHSENGK